MSPVWGPLLRSSQNMYKMAASKKPNLANNPLGTRVLWVVLAPLRQPLFVYILRPSEKRPPNQRHSVGKVQPRAKYVALFLKSLKGFKQANSIQLLISGFLIIPPLLITFSEQTNEPYRLIPLVIFFAIGASTLLGKIKQDEP